MNQFNFCYEIVKLTFLYLVKRENVEHKLEETRQQLNNIKASWSDKISSLELQIQHLNSKMSEDQVKFLKRY